MKFATWYDCDGILRQSCEHLSELSTYPWLLWWFCYFKNFEL